MGKRQRSQQRQLTFGAAFGIRAKGGGRKKGKDSGPSHLRREDVDPNTPVHVVMRLVEGLPDLRRVACYEVIWSAFEQGCERAGRREDGEFRLVEYSIQGNHLHLMI